MMYVLVWYQNVKDELSGGCVDFFSTLADAKKEMKEESKCSYSSFLEESRYKKDIKMTRYDSRIVIKDMFSGDTLVYAIYQRDYIV